MSQAATGKFADSLVFMTTGFGGVVRSHVIPTNPNTAAQQGVRAALAWSGQEWAELTDQQKASWANAPREKPISDFCAFQRACLNSFANNKGGIRQYPAPAADLPTAPTDLDVAVDGRQAVVTWTDQTAAKLFGVKVHIGASADFTPSPNNLKAIADEGDQTAILRLDPGTYYVKLVAFDFGGNCAAATVAETFTIV